MALYREQGIVLRTHKLGEADRIVHVLTQGRGKVRAVAKGVRKPSSRFGGRLEPFSHVDLQLYEGRSLDVVTQAELIMSFEAVRADYPLSACASTLVEGADLLAQEGERLNSLFLVVLDGLRALRGHPTDPATVLDACLFRLASVAGYHPSLHACAGCQAPGPQEVFHIAAGGFLCASCAPDDAQPLDDETVALLCALGSADWYHLDAADTGPRARRAAAAIVSSFLTYHLGKPLRSLELVPR